jgi:hypothetical protein
MQPVLTPELAELLRWSNDKNAGPRMERRGGGTISHMDGRPIEYRTAGKAHSAEAASYRARVEALIKQSEELLGG